MSKIVIVDPSDLTAKVYLNRHLGGKESCVLNLSHALSAKNHQLHIFTNNEHNKGECESDVYWHNLGSLNRVVASIGKPDLLISNGAIKSINQVDAKQYAVWLHNNPNYLWKKTDFYNKLLYSGRFLRTRFLLSGKFHYGQWTKNRILRKYLCRIIPLAVADPFYEHRVPCDTPPKSKTVVFLSDPRRGLTSVLALWVGHIHKLVPEAELHVYGSASDMGISQSDNVVSTKSNIISLAAALSEHRVFVKKPLGIDALPKAIRGARLLLYAPDRFEETFCLSVAETQTLGIPVVVNDSGALPERVEHGKTGYIETTPPKLAQRAVELLTDDQIWLEFHRNAIARTPRTWLDYADDLCREFRL